MKGFCLDIKFVHCSTITSAALKFYAFVLEPAPPVEKRKYERDFLLQFQFMQMCTEKPAGLPDIEVVLDYPAPASKSGGGSQR